MVHESMRRHCTPVRLFWTTSFNFQCAPFPMDFSNVCQTGSKRGSGRITVVHLVKCLEEMDYILDGDTRDFIRSVVPKAFEANELGLQDAIKVMLRVQYAYRSYSFFFLTVNLLFIITFLYSMFHKGTQT